ncbi:MAG: stress response translation initiation inhibitor YciH [Candidatus Aenigmarchaeota archaeon]|nr:stress response translation initiation inhibitor YciH [Candidatus Aenigmarchaeota archaeon]
MIGICPKCGLNKELCICESLAKEKEKIRVSGIKRRYGKFITIVQGMSKDVEPKKVLKELKTKLACGGTLKDGVIELQGNHKDSIKKILVKMGFQEDQINVG